MDFNLEEYFSSSIPQNLLVQASDSRKTKQKQIRILLEKKKLPDSGWDEATILEFLQYLSSLDSNNLQQKCCVGEREGKVFSNLVRQLNLNFSHGIGRSGNLNEHQPKAIGSSILVTLVNQLLLDLVQSCGLRSVKKCCLIPMATGMSLMLCLLSFRQIRPNGKYVLWSRIDQKSCFKAITTAGFVPIIIDPIRSEGGDELQTNIAEFKEKIQNLEPSNILCIYSTTSCFAPRACDNVKELSELAKEFNIPHLINNAYGLQSTWCNHQIEQAARIGRVDLVVQSTDKNLMVPVGGAILAGFDNFSVDNVAVSYCGRASSSQVLNVAITLLEMGKMKYLSLMQERKAIFKLFNSKLKEIVKKYGERVLETPGNPISMAVTLESLPKDKAREVGSMLFRRGVSGVRILVSGDEKVINGCKFDNFGTHSSIKGPNYMTVAASMGITEEEINVFMEKFTKVMDDLIKKNKKS